MGKREQIQYWIDSAKEDWESVQTLLQGKHYLQALFFSNLTIEKLLKAHWLVSNEGLPPRTHDLIYLLDQTEMELDGEDIGLLNTVTTWNLEGRYPDYKKSLHKMANEKYVKENLDKVTQLRKCLLEKLS